ncbi:phosphonate ABC transporter ATP-binding protein [Aestuariirhabdus sp. Z084]|uniref:phosphonate ABC transporter ATP-binding protein n=1 Tax=Aestuariirhabdus haliotis TaxID=2918751 RepID=UPI00201B41F2|nr:phosphonate ABC transporter ATP-binding protein [Aestuariirhabdus haliotis]MCL6417430.1 phosphonate ABC transporter ATP-binding protein [Aestuariirhabdus haliotis]MCL6421374.1 phosphonate ABC transporter ATP-binding protein [Aestuariirhabdus haliotis]
MSAAEASVEAQNFLDIRGLKKEYTSGNPVLKGIDITIDQPGIIAIIGPSGTGKSTLLRCINRLIDPTEGEIIFDQADLCTAKGLQLRKLRRHVGMVFQEYNLVERLSVIENVLTGRLGYMSAWSAWRRKFRQQDINTAFELLDAVGLTEHASARADSLSGGQRQRVGIARAVMQNPRILLADEPTSSLDPKTAVEIMELLERFAQEKNIPALVNIHDVTLARRFAKRMIGMSNGQVVYDGEPDGITDDDLKLIYGGESWLV